jgi:subtilase family serine protease
MTTDDNLFSEITALGVSIFASAGDEGATPADDGDAGGSTLTPENPASDPNVTGVGGTSLTVNPNGTASSEGVWNNVTVSSTTGATGGGISYEFSRPSWQTGTGVNTSANRQVPDIAADADEETGAYVILDGQTDEYGGTSLSSPMWAGFTALINQARGSVSKSAIGLLNPSLYPLIGTANFRDITSGNNIFDSSQGYSAGVGFDLCTGCGVPDVANLAETLSGVTSLTPVLVSAVSVQSHAGTNYSIALPLTGTPGVECRGINQTLHLVCTFDRPVTAGAAAVTEGSGSVGTISFSGDTMTVNLNGVSNAQELTVEVSGLNRSSASASVDLGVLLGDINGDGAVNAQDVTIDRNAVESVAGTSGFNPGTDINLDGAVNAQDVTIVRNAVETFIPDF